MIILTDCMYRGAIAATHSLVELGEAVIAVTTDKNPSPPSFFSKYIKERHIFSSDKEKYKEELLELCSKYDRPVILPIGVFTSNIISENRSEFLKTADFAISPPECLDILNNKKLSKEIARNVGISVPERSTAYPMVVKPFCGEKFGLKASERYKIVNNEKELEAALNIFSDYDSEPLVEEYIDGYGVGVSVIIGNDGIERSAFCHKRLCEYPASGGPSSSLITFRDDSIINKSVAMLRSVGFIGIAMVEFKVRNGEYYFLEVNPRIWGSFAATHKAKSDFVKGYLSASRNTKYEFSPFYKKKKIKFVPNIFASILSYLKARSFKMAARATIDALNPLVSIAVFSIKDPIPAIKDIFRKRGKHE